VLPLGTTIAVQTLEDEPLIPLNTKETEPLTIDKSVDEFPLESQPVVHDDVTLAESAPTNVEPVVSSSYVDPFDSPSRQTISEESFIRDIRTAGDDGPTATPGLEALKTAPRGIDHGSSTALSDVTNGNNIKMRNTPPNKRPSTPTSISSPYKDKNAKNILAAIWQTVFVEWIGGFITRLCGGM
jgi:hypothetical protein